MHPAEISEEDLLNNCTVKTGRRSGPGGQHRNKVETAVVIEHTPTGIRAEATERRSQLQNKVAAIFRLRINLALQTRSLRSESTPTALWKSRTKAKRISVNSSHHDFPSLLAEALDVCHANEYNVSAAAERLSVSTSQLTKFLKQEPKALALVNERREERGQGRLR